MEINDIKANKIVSEISHEKDNVKDEKLKKAAQDFEAFFIGAMFKSMRQTVPDSGLVKKGQGEEIYREMLDAEVATQLSRGKGLGLAELMYSQLKEKEIDK